MNPRYLQGDLCLGGTCYRAPLQLRKLVRTGAQWFAGPWWLSFVPGWSDLVERGLLTPEEIQAAAATTRRVRPKRRRR